MPPSNLSDDLRLHPGPEVVKKLYNEHPGYPMATAALKLQQGNTILRKYAEVEQAVIFGS
jgi:hypothetical protein